MATSRGCKPEDDSEAGDKKRPRRYGENGSVMAGETGKSWSNCVDLVNKNVETSASKGRSRDSSLIKCDIANELEIHP